MAHNAPGKHYRTGLSLVEVIRMFPDDATAEQWFIRAALAQRRVVSQDVV